MGMYNDIKADLVCPVTGMPTPGITIQIKWQDHNSLYLRTYAEDSPARVVISPSKGSHYAFVEMRNGVILRVLTEKEFAEIGVKEFANYW